jgi:hypothetical protein
VKAAARRVAVILAPALAACAPPLAAQSVPAVNVGVHAVLVTHTEVSLHRRARGLGEGAAASLQSGRFTLSGNVLQASVSARTPSPAKFTVTQWDLRVDYAIRPWLAVEAGTGRRQTAPSTLAEDVGWLRAGLRFETPLTSIARMWVSGALLPVTRFDGGGTGGTALDVGFGLTVALRGQGLSGLVRYDFQRIGRTVGGLQAPVMLETARIGATLRIL